MALVSFAYMDKLSQKGYLKAPPLTGNWVAWSQCIHQGKLWNNYRAQHLYRHHSPARFVWVYLPSRVESVRTVKNVHYLIASMHGPDLVYTFLVVLFCNGRIKKHPWTHGRDDAWENLVDKLPIRAAGNSFWLAAVYSEKPCSEAVVAGGVVLGGIYRAERDMGGWRLYVNE